MLAQRESEGKPDQYRIGCVCSKFWKMEESQSCSTYAWKMVKTRSCSKVKRNDVSASYSSVSELVDVEVNNLSIPVRLPAGSYILCSMLGYYRMPALFNRSFIID